MNVIARGFAAGFIATLALSVVMIAKQMTGIMPELSIIRLLSDLLNDLAALPAHPASGWGAHFAIGTLVWGGIFGTFNRAIYGQREITKGMALGVFAWVAMMFAVMPLAGAGLFGYGIDLMTPVVTLVLHLFYGAVLGSSYAWLTHGRPVESTET
ncbi:MAG: hypothetical protein EOM26_08060 [Alphaproteobacteria bacterium]|nr:hypothetical protein [Alphaproteobacteria bacterium]